MRGTVESATRPSGTPLLGSGSDHVHSTSGGDKGMGQRGGFEPAIEALGPSGGLPLPQPLPFQVHLGSCRSQRGSMTPARLVVNGFITSGGSFQPADAMCRAHPTGRASCIMRQHGDPFLITRLLRYHAVLHWETISRWRPVPPGHPGQIR